MVGREAKHIALTKFTHNFQFNKRWIQVFKHKYISLVWLRAIGCNETVYKETLGVYIPKRCDTAQFCHCRLPRMLMLGNATFALINEWHEIIAGCVIQRKITNKAKALTNKLLPYLIVFISKYVYIVVGSYY